MQFKTLNMETVSLQIRHTAVDTTSVKKYCASYS